MQCAKSLQIVAHHCPAARLCRQIHNWYSWTLDSPAQFFCKLGLSVILQRKNIFYRYLAVFKIGEGNVQERKIVEFS